MQEFSLVTKGNHICQTRCTVSLHRSRHRTIINSYSMKNIDRFQIFCITVIISDASLYALINVFPKRMVAKISRGNRNNFPHKNHKFVQYLPKALPGFHDMFSSCGKKGTCENVHMWFCVPTIW